jgi:acyl carrier protein
MNRQEILQKVIELAFSINLDDDITEFTNIENDLDWDDLDKIEFIIDLENEFNIHIVDDMFINLNTIENFVDYIINRV